MRLGPKAEEIGRKRNLWNLLQGYTISSGKRSFGWFSKKGDTVNSRPSGDTKAAEKGERERSLSSTGKKALQEQGPTGFESTQLEEKKKTRIERSSGRRPD